MKLTLKQTVYLLRKEDGTLENLLRITLTEAADGEIAVFHGPDRIYAGSICGEYTFTYAVPEPMTDTEIEITAVGETEQVSARCTLHPVKHWELHIVQTSHHDPGYTDIMSHVCERHYEWVDQMLDEMDKRDDYPHDSRLRITIEQFWSLDYFLRKAPADRVHKLIERVKRGDIALTAMYGNLITEQLGHEEIYRSLYDAAAFGEKCGVPVRTAMHNDIPGVSWGLCRALCDAGIRFLNADLPRYYNWGYAGMSSFYDIEEAVGHGAPYLFRWISPDNKELLFWDGGTTIIGGMDPDNLEMRLETMQAEGYPLEIVQFCGHHTNIDNSCYTVLYPDASLTWNRKYAYPHIVNSTSEMFLDALTKEIADKQYTVPALRGEIPGQDYPVAAMSMAQITSTARRMQSRAVLAEKLQSIAEANDPAVVPSQKPLFTELWRDLLLADDHAYGYQFPAGPAMRASYWEKGVLAMRAEANAHDLCDKALASLADRVAANDTSLRLIVFNPADSAGVREVSTILREHDNCGTILHPSNRDPNRLAGYLLNNRRRVNPPPEIWKDAAFKLIDMADNREIPYCIDTMRWDDPEYYAPESVGLGSGTKRYGFMEEPGGMKRILRFTADVPAFGYKMYALVPAEVSPALPMREAHGSIENEFYRISYDSQGITSVLSLRDNRELTDPHSPYRMGDILLRYAKEMDTERMSVDRIEAVSGGIYHEIRIYASISGAHDVLVRFSLWNGVDTVHTDVRLLKSAAPLQSVFAAFPFAGSGFSYEGVLSEMVPGRDILPGAHSDFLTCRDYVRVEGSGIHWSSADTAVAALGQLWKGYISPAHSCITEFENHVPLTEKDFSTGHIYALLACNNFGTNFMCSQVFDSVYKFSFSCRNTDSAAASAAWGDMAQNPVLTQFTDRSRGSLPPSACVLDCGSLHCLTLKKAMDDNGFVARLWNHNDTDEEIRLRINGKEITDFTACSALEKPLNTPVRHIPAGSVLTIRFSCMPM